MSFCELKDVVDRYRPDILLSMDSRVGTIGCRWAGMMMPGTGTDAVAMWADCVRNCLRLPAEDGWRSEI